MRDKCIQRDHKSSCTICQGGISVSPHFNSERETVNNNFVRYVFTISVVKLSKKMLKIKTKNFKGVFFVFTNISVLKYFKSFWLHWFHQL